MTGKGSSPVALHTLRCARTLDDDPVENLGLYLVLAEARTVFGGLAWVCLVLHRDTDLADEASGSIATHSDVWLRDWTEEL